MHHNHTTRPQHIRHHIGLHQGPMHHQPPVGMNMGAQIGPPQHHMPNMQPPHVANQPMRQYIPPNQRGDMTRFNLHNQPRLQQPMHQPSLQSKLRTSSSHHNGLIPTSIPPLTSQQQQQQQHQHQQQQQHQQQKNYQQQAVINQQPNLSKHQIPPKHHVPLLQNKLGLVQKKSLPQHLSHPPPSLVHSKPPPLPTKQQLSKQPVLQPPTSTTSKHVTIHSQHHSIPQQLSPSLQQHAASASILSPQTSISNAPTSPGNQALQLQSLQRQQSFQQQKQQQHQSASGPSLQTPVSVAPTSPGNQTHQLQIQRQQSLQQQQQPQQPQSTHQPISAVTQKPLATQQQQQNKSAQLQSQNISKQTTISSTTNSVLVSITHQQIQQTQQTVVVQQQTRQGQSLDNQTKNAQISQSSPTSNNNINTSNNSPNEKSSELIRGIALPNTTNETLANSKEKTPMCLVNELARYNKIQHQYRLTGEQGPAHSKRFTVTLRLGEEEYTSDGLSIKKAQHSAAADAISKTKYQHPPAKSNRLKSGIKPGLGNITPTVELNALAMKLGEPTLYLLDNNQPAGDGTTVRNNNPTATPAAAGQQHQQMPAQAGAAGIPPQTNQYSMPLHPNYFAENQFTNFHRGNPPNGTHNSQRFPSYARRPFVKGPLKFNTNQQRMIPYNNLAVNGAPREPCRITLVVGMRKFVGIGGTLQAARHDAATRALEVLKPLANDDAPESSNESTDDANSDLKSPISLVHEIALKRNMIVTFDVTSEIGPPHMKTFLTICKVGNIVTEGEGNGKKISKKRAAENMLEELRKLPPVSPSRVIQTITKLKNFANKRKPQPIKRKTRNIIKDQSEPEYSEEVNPISKLIQIQQALKEREPTYTVVEERGAPRRREFVIEVSVSGHTARGTGTNKKMAKRLAAENLLSLLGFTTPAGNGTKDPNANKLINNNNNVESSAEKGVQHVKFQDSVDINSLDMNGSRQIGSSTHLMQQKPLNSVLKGPTVNGPKNDCGESTVSTTASTVGEKNSFTGDGVRPKDQLLYLGQLLGFQVQYSDYPKGNHGAYLSIVTLTTDPPQLCHGAGNKIEESQDEASLTALKLLSELGLDNVKPKKSNPEEIKT